MKKVTVARTGHGETKQKNVSTKKINQSKKPLVIGSKQKSQIK